LNPGILCIEVEDEVNIAITVDILDMTPFMSFSRPIGFKRD